MALIVFANIGRRLVSKNQVFGGLRVLLVGDPDQLHPVRDRKIFDQHYCNICFLDFNTSLSPNFKLAELTQMLRQIGDKAFAHSLSRSRTNGHTKLIWNFSKLVYISTVFLDHRDSGFAVEN